MSQVTFPELLADKPKEADLSPWILLAEQGLVPDFLIRMGIRRLLSERLHELRAHVDSEQEALMKWIEIMRQSPIAVHTDKANEQHYEVPPEFFVNVLGKHLKYSSCYFADGVKSLDEAESHMLRLSCERAEIKPGMKILELGCGWGSLTLWMAEHYPTCMIQAVSNSAPQREWIMARARERGLNNILIVTADMNQFSPSQTFDRVVSIEMFEHMRNWELLLSRIHSWLNPAGKLFVHVFSHHLFAYPFETKGQSDWMGRFFFTGGMMPADRLMTYFQKHLRLERHWAVSGMHYAKTSEAWLKNLDAHKKDVLPVLAAVYGKEQASRWLHRWRIFFLACAELFGYKSGKEWLVSHYLLTKGA